MLGTASNSLLPGFTKLSLLERQKEKEKEKESICPNSQVKKKPVCEADLRRIRWSLTFLSSLPCVGDCDPTVARPERGNLSEVFHLKLVHIHLWIFPHRHELAHDSTIE